MNKLSIITLNQNNKSHMSFNAPQINLFVGCHSLSSCATPTPSLLYYLISNMFRSLPKLYLGFRFIFFFTLVVLTTQLYYLVLTQNNM